MFYDITASPVWDEIERILKYEVEPFLSEGEKENIDLMFENLYNIRSNNPYELSKGGISYIIGYIISSLNEVPNGYRAYNGEYNIHSYHGNHGLWVISLPNSLAFLRDALRESYKYLHLVFKIDETIFQRDYEDRFTIREEEIYWNIRDDHYPDKFYMIHGSLEIVTSGQWPTAFIYAVERLLMQDKWKKKIHKPW